METTHRARTALLALLVGSLGALSCRESPAPGKEPVACPSTRKALASFPEVGALRLVELPSAGRHLGVVVQTRAQAEALMAHLRATMKAEAPRFVCLDVADERPRDIPIADGK